MNNMFIIVGMIVILIISIILKVLNIIYVRNNKQDNKTISLMSDTCNYSEYIQVHNEITNI